jgi:hypothetical protein
MRIAPLLITPDDHVRYGNAIRHCRAEMLDLVEKAISDTVHHEQARKCLVELDLPRTELEIHLHGIPRPQPRRSQDALAGSLEPVALNLLDLKSFGKRIAARDPVRQTAEIHIRVALMNRFNALGTAEIVRVA